MSNAPRTVMMSQAFKAGDIVRFGSGSTALAKLVAPHAGGWIADHCMGGGTYLSVGPHTRLADSHDMQIWAKCGWHRGEGIPPIWRPRIKKEAGRWVVKRCHGVPGRWREAYIHMVTAAQQFTWNLNERLPA